MKFKYLLFLIFSFLFLTFKDTYALSAYLNMFNSTYGTSGTVLNTCNLCHTGKPSASTTNSFANDYSNNGYNFKTIENLDSDNDGFTNIAEINAKTFPGDPNSKPGGTTDTTPPTVTAFSIPATSNSLTVAITTFTATDNVAVTGYMVTESATAPAANSTGWNASAPTSYTFATQGTKTLYAWAKDAAGNVSTSRSASVTITIPVADTTPPTVTAFSIPATSNSLTVAITTFTATDNVAVTGYMVTESATAPAANSTGWNASAPTSYTFATQGTKTLYAWAKDAAGNVSTSRSASVTITIPVADTTPPTTPTNLTANAISPNKVSLSWSPSIDNVGVTGYIILRDGVQIGTSTTTSYNDNSVLPSTTYSYIVRAKDAAGNVSPDNQSVQITTPTIDNSNLSVLTPNGGEVVASGSTLNISWNPQTGASYYKVLYSINNNQMWKVIANKVNTTSFDWIVPSPRKNSNCLVAVYAYNDKNMKIAADTSDSPFIIEVAKIISPKSGETLLGGQSYTIIWENNVFNGTVAKVTISYNFNNSLIWKTAATINGNPGSYNWTIPSLTKDITNAKVRVIFKNQIGTPIAVAISHVFSITSGGTPGDNNDNDDDYIFNELGSIKENENGKIWTGQFDVNITKNGMISYKSKTSSNGYISNSYPYNMNGNILSVGNENNIYGAMTNDKSFVIWTDSGLGSDSGLGIWAGTKTLKGATKSILKGKFLAAVLEEDSSINTSGIPSTYFMSLEFDGQGGVTKKIIKDTRRENENMVEQGNYTISNDGSVVISFGTSNLYGSVNGNGNIVVFGNTDQFGTKLNIGFAVKDAGTNTISGNYILNRFGLGTEISKMVATVRETTFVANTMSYSTINTMATYKSEVNTSANGNFSFSNGILRMSEKEYGVVSSDGEVLVSVNIDKAKPYITIGVKKH